MRKSERIRLLELEIVKLNMEVQYIGNLLSALLEVDELKQNADLDAGKWYKRKPERND